MRVRLQNVQKVPELDCVRSLKKTTSSFNFKIKTCVEFGSLENCVPRRNHHHSPAHLRSETDGLATDDGAQAVQAEGQAGVGRSSSDPLG